MKINYILLSNVYNFFCRVDHFDVGAPQWSYLCANSSITFHHLKVSLEIILHSIVVICKQINSPWHVRVQSNSKWLQCSGAIVNSTAVVTAASCLLVSGNLISVSQLSVVAGSAGLYTLDSSAMSTNVRH